MTVEVIRYNGERLTYEALSFEFRTNQVSNWIRIKLSDGNTVLIQAVCTIKTK